MKNIVLISSLLAGQTALQGMHSTLSLPDTVTLLVGERESQLKIARNYALLSRTIKNSLDDARSSQSAEECITCPLQEVSEEVLRVIIGHLERLFEYRHTKNIDLLTAIKDDLSKLSPVQLSEVARAIEYLDIPILGACCAEVAQEKLRPGVVDWHSIASLPVSLLSTLIKREIAALAGITYEDQVSSQISRDKDIDRVDPAHSLTGRGQVPILSTQAIGKGHTDYVYSVCVTSDNKIVSCSEDKTIRVWDTQGTPLAVCRGHKDIVWSVCVTSDNKIVSASEDKTVRVWDMQGTQLAVCRGHEKRVNSVCITPDSKIVSGSGDGTVRVWDMEGTELAVCRGHKGSVWSVCITPNSKIVSGSHDETVRVWDIHGNQLGVCRGHEAWVNAVCVTSDNQIVSSSDDGTVRVWDIDGKKLAVCRGHEDGIESVSVTSDGKIVSGSFDGTVRVWDMQGTQRAVCRGHEDGIKSLSVTSDGKIMSGSFDGTVRVWDMQGTQLAVCRGHEDEIESVCVTSDSKIVSVSQDKTVRAWDLHLLMLVQRAPFLYDRDHAQALWSLLSSHHKQTLSKEDCLEKIKRLMS